MEFVLVTYPRDRQVRVDLQPQGQTNEVLRVEAGFHRFDLSQPVDYTPPLDERIVTGTSFDEPMIILFTPIPVVAVPAEALPEAEAPRARRRKGRKPTKKKRRPAKKAKAAKKRRSAKKSRAAKKGRTAKKARKTTRRKASKRRSRSSR